MALAKYDVVDVQITSDTADCDAILDYPLLDGEKKYTLELTEFTCPLSGEHPMQLLPLTSRSLPIFEIRFRAVGSEPGAAATLLDALFQGAPQDVRDAIARLRDFSVIAERSVRVVNDLVFEANEFFRQIQNIFVANPVLDPTGDEWKADPFCRMRLDASGVCILNCSEIFMNYFFINVTPYGRFLLGFENYIASGVDAGGDHQSGLAGLLLVNQQITASQVAVPAQRFKAAYSLTRNFDLRVALELETPGMRIPGQIKWTVEERQSVKFSLASFPIETNYTSTIPLTTTGVPTEFPGFSSTLFGGNHVFRRAEDKVKERYLITNSRFYQNVRVTLEIERRHVRVVGDDVEVTFLRTPIQLPPSAYWSAKLRFRTLKK